MATQSTNKKRGTRQNLPDMLYNYCFVIAFVISLLGQCGAGMWLVNHQLDERSSEKSYLYDRSDYALHLLLNFPIDTEPEGEGNEVTKDSGADQDRDNWLGNSAPGCIFRYSVAKTSSSNFISGIKNRRPVSLVILYHSWKSFLS